MKKLCSTAVLLAAAAVPVVSFAASSSEQQIKQLQLDMKQLQQQVAQLQGAGTSSGGLVHVGPLYKDGPMVSQIGAIGQEQNILVTRQKMSKMGQQLPLLSIGGLLESDIGYGRNTNLDGNYFDDQRTSDAELTAARIHIMANINDWTTGFIYYDFLASNLRTGKVTFGNLNETPFYASIGKSYTYFGNWTGPNIISTDVASALFESRSDNAMLGYTKGGFNAQLGMTSPTTTVYTDTSSTHTNHASLVTQARYTFDLGNKNSAYFGAGYMSDINGTEVSALSQAQPADGHSRLPVADVHAGATFGPVSINAEYATTLVKVQNYDDNLATGTTTNSDKVSAFEIDASYNFKIKSYASYVAFGYSQSQNAANLKTYYTANTGSHQAGDPLNSGSTIAKRIYSLDTGISLDNRTDLGVEVARMESYDNTGVSPRSYLVGFDMTVHF
ncbi:LbtU family siderophore porin [Piscirickettsia litoralis]|uniref:Porin n=1 Tax=Piscirickettsia litoralis TaxID=1891921 RepID=A0ABX3A790_9GAMM|nr:LbtU family siderophore porin [Piscirickettsia litoralis]ODN43493.1 hypothetical protein BGC07_11905 [Piscirickettsia litoralis]